MANKNELYQNAPLVETVFELRFPGEPAIECKRDVFYEKIRKEYVKVFVPNCSEGKALALQPYGFETEDGTRSIRLAINKISYICKNYAGFKLFKSEALRIFSIFKDLFNIQTLNRTGLRYINIIPITREKDIIPIDKYLNVNIGLPESIPTNFKGINLIFISQTKEGSITTRIEPVISHDQMQEAIILDFDFTKEKNLKFDMIEKYIDESHKHTKHLFEELIVEDYKKVMRGEVI